MLNNYDLFWNRARFHSNESGDSFLLGCVREVLVDLGFGKLLEMVGEKFGPFPLNFLLLCIFLGTVAGTLNLFITSGVIPTYKFFASLSEQTYGSIVIYLGKLALTASIAFIGVWVGMYIYEKLVWPKRLKRQEKSALEARERISALIKENSDALDMLDGQMAQLDKLSQALSGKADITLKDIEEFKSKMIDG